MHFNSLLKKLKPQPEKASHSVKLKIQELGEFVMPEASWQEHENVRLKTDVITIGTESALLDLINSDSDVHFIKLRGRETASVGGTVGPTVFVEDGTLDQGWLQKLTQFVSDNVDGDMRSHKLNHILINKYPPGGGIMPHEDGPRYYPVVNILSLGSGCVMQFSHKSDSMQRFKIYIPPRSLLQFKGAVYREYLHSIDFCAFDAIDASVRWAGDLQEVPRAERISLTFRHVPEIAIENREYRR